jgi:hypothetical protein
MIYFKVSFAVLLVTALCWEESQSCLFGHKKNLDNDGHQQQHNLLDDNGPHGEPQVQQQ